MYDILLPAIYFGLIYLRVCIKLKQWSLKCDMHQAALLFHLMPASCNQHTAPPIWHKSKELLCFNYSTWSNQIYHMTFQFESQISDSLWIVSMAYTFILYPDLDIQEQKQMYCWNHNAIQMLNIEGTYRRRACRATSWSEKELQVHSLSNNKQSNKPVFMIVECDENTML